MDGKREEYQAHTRSNLVSKPTNISNKLHGCSTSSILLSSGGDCQTQGVIDYIVLLRKLIAVCRKERPRSIIQQRQQMDAALRILDLGIKLLTVIVDTDQLDEDAFTEEDKRRDECSSEDQAQDVLPVLDGIGSDRDTSSFLDSGFTTCVRVPGHEGDKGTQRAESPARQRKRLLQCA